MKDYLIETIKEGSEIDCSTLVKMGFQKGNNLWINTNGDATDIYESSNVGEDYEGIDMNALVAYVSPMERGKPLSNFERVMFHRLDTISAEQRQYFEMTTSRFQYLLDQIEVVQEKLVELYHRDV